MTDTSRRTARRTHATIKEVAERAGVSQMTVSRVLNRSEVVREATRLKVEEAIRDLHYRPNLLARGLAGGKSLFIGLIFHNPSNSYLGELLVGALERCREAGHHLVIEDFTSDDLERDSQAFVERLSGAGLDGVVVAPPISEETSVLRALDKAGMVTVLIAPREFSPGGMSVSINDRAAADAMTQHLISQGHRRIGFIKGPDNQISSSRRWLGFGDAMQRNGIDMPPTHVAQGQYTYRSGMEAAASLLQLPSRPTAIFASNDDMAAGAIACAFRMGLRVPEDVSIAGFDDTPFASAIWPQLTTMRQPIADMAAEAISLLSHELDGSGPEEGSAEAMGMKDRHMVLDVSLIRRSSVVARG